MWIQWIDKFGEEIGRNMQISEFSKYEILRGVLRDIIVSYDHEKQVHTFTINFNIPIFMEDKSGKNSLRQKSKGTSKTCFPPSLPNSDPTYYSTVTCQSPTTVFSKGYSLNLSIQVSSSHLWVPPYSDYQQKLFDIISNLHENEGWNFKRISDWLVEHDYLTPRGTTFNQPKCWSIYQKKKRSLKRFTRSFTHSITDLGIEVVDYTPHLLTPPS
jgi:hypothetical protein